MNIKMKIKNIKNTKLFEIFDLKIKYTTIIILFFSECSRGDWLLK